MSDTDPEELAARLRLTTGRLARLLRQQAGNGLSPSQQSALISIDLHGPLTLGRLAKIEQVTPPTISRIVGRLEDDGLVTRQVDDSDRRVARVQISAEGRRRLDYSRQRRNAWLAQRLEHLDAAARQSLLAALPALEALIPDPDLDASEPARSEAPA